MVEVCVGIIQPLTDLADAVRVWGGCYLRDNFEIGDFIYLVVWLIGVS
jgi:hypothetical protein